MSVEIESEYATAGTLSNIRKTKKCTPLLHMIPRDYDLIIVS